MFKLIAFAVVIGVSFVAGMLTSLQCLLNVNALIIIILLNLRNYVSIS